MPRAPFCAGGPPVCGRWPIAYGYGLTEWNVAAAVGERFVNGEIVEFGIAAFGEKTVEGEEGIACTPEGFSLIGDHHSAANVIETLSVGAVAELRPFVLEVACYSQVQFRFFKRLLDGCVGSKVIEAYDRAVVFTSMPIHSYGMLSSPRPATSPFFILDASRVTVATDTGPMPRWVRVFLPNRDFWPEVSSAVDGLCAETTGCHPADGSTAGRAGAGRCRNCRCGCRVRVVSLLS